MGGGSLVIVIAVSAWTGVGRTLRLLIVPLGMWIVVALCLLDSAGNAGAAIVSALLSLALIALSVPRARAELIFIPSLLSSESNL